MPRNTSQNMENSQQGKTNLRTKELPTNPSVVSDMSCEPLVMLTAQHQPHFLLPLPAGELGFTVTEPENLKVLSKQNVLHQVPKQLFGCLWVAFGVPVNFQQLLTLFLVTLPVPVRREEHLQPDKQVPGIPAQVSKHPGVAGQLSVGPRGGTKAQTSRHRCCQLYRHWRRGRGEKPWLWPGQAWQCDTMGH